MRGPVLRPIVIAAGGTGGHMFPAAALAGELIARGRRVVLLTDARSGALATQDFGPERHVLRGSGLAGRGAWHAARGVIALARGTWQARRIMRRLDCPVLVAFGGYPAVPPVIATRLLRRRPMVVLHEQNAVLGRANRLLARCADLIATGFAHTRHLPAHVATLCTGNPVRGTILAHRYTAPETGEIHLLVLGGSLGARVFADVVPAALASLPDALRARLRVVQQIRAEDLDRVRTAYAAGGIAAELSPFFAEIGARLATAHLVISRAGASSCAELLVAARPALLVPLPGAIDDHQSRNAAALADAGAAWVMAQPAFTADALRDKLAGLLSAPALLSAASVAAGYAAHGDAASVLADLVEARMGQETLA